MFCTEARRARNPERAGLSSAFGATLRKARHPAGRGPGPTSRSRARARARGFAAVWPRRWA
eukprot:3437247-Lingulodinium_polyedra.AAC.1